MKKNIKIVDFLFEVGTMRKITRMHRQALLLTFYTWLRYVSVR